MRRPARSQRKTGCSCAAGARHAPAGSWSILAHESLFRIDLVVGVAGSVGFALLALALYRLLERVNRAQAVRMAALVIGQAPQSFVSELNRLAALVLVRGPEFTSVFDQRQREALAMLFLRADIEGALVSQVS